MHHASNSINGIWNILLFVVSSLMEALDLSASSGNLPTLVQLSEIIDTCWALFGADDISRLEAFYEDESKAIKDREQAALVLSKTYYHLGDYDQSLLFALSAGPSIIEWSNCDEWIQVLKTKAIDLYTSNPNHLNISKSTLSTSIITSNTLVSVIDAIIERALSLGQYYEVVGIALSSGRIDICRRALELCHGSSKFSLLQHMYEGLISVNSDSYKHVNIIIILFWLGSILISH